MSLAYGKEIVAGIAPAQRDTTPLGTIIAFMGTTAPDLYLACDGSVYNIVDYPDFAEFLDEQFGSVGYFGGDGTTTFAVPDLRGEFLRGTGTNGHSNQGNGADVGEHQDGTEHIHLVGEGSIGKFTKNPMEPVDYDSMLGPISNNWYANILSSAGAAQGQQYYTSRPTNTSVNYCIKVKLSGLEFVDRNEAPEIQNGHDYRTYEQVVGTWIDGKPLYEKTITLTTASKTDTWVLANISDAIENGFISDGFVISTGGTYIPVNYYRNTELYVVAAVTPGTAKVGLLVHAVSEFLNRPAYITVRYTKTTD